MTLQPSKPRQQALNLLGAMWRPDASLLEPLVVITEHVKNFGSTREANCAARETCLRDPPIILASNAQRDIESD
jgi:hypothetical protein